ncbi:dihydropteroate synthase [Allobranchiibius sp. CTAmp26]|uniref:dihydropteroate synthase n=1 Tax=Allobranchiibius sp. CTAmp26 TaxID=2815214 RepID=UPI0027DAB7FE|nr:dihydropteroate synthase [Allobranchiibius sp. CTAmp26]
MGLNAPTPTAALVLRGRTYDAANPAVMAIVNRTPDSFWEGNRHHDLSAALDALHLAVADGADIVDVGGVRAGQEGPAVDAALERRRVLPFLEAARTAYPHLVLSLDTWRSEVAGAAEGVVDLINDTWAGHDPRLVHVAARIGAGIVCSHTGGLPPRTDPVAVRYATAEGDEEEALLRDVRAQLTGAARDALEAGIPRERILLDPTLDFGKTTRHSLSLLRRTSDVVALGFPVLQAISRKDFLGETLDLPVDQRLEAGLAATAVAAWQGATVFRTHDVLATRRVLDMVAVIRGDRAPQRTVRGEPGAAEG